MTTLALITLHPVVLGVGVSIIIAVVLLTVARLKP
jgi:hypothetical protein